MDVDITFLQKVDTNDNISDIFTNSIPGWKRVQ